MIFQYGDSCGPLINSPTISIQFYGCLVAPATWLPREELAQFAVVTIRKHDLLGFRHLIEKFV